MFSKVLVANRGEIAVRILRTLRELGLASVAVCSDVDREALHARLADETVGLGDPRPAASYLDIAKLLDAARRTGAQAIHPGYGFLAENPEFARRVADAGLVFIGPSADALARLGNKTAARRTMRGVGVPIIPGLDAPESDPRRLADAAERLGYPVLVKAAAGGGGKGMRVAASPAELQEAAEAAAGEAASSFGDGAIYLEKYLDRPRHVEFQILADAHGNVVHLFERECSIQRRHQKLVEETPSPALDEELRERMGRAAVAAARAAGYVNAGTVEFLLVGRDFYFLEVNARIQVEHPITELLTGLDLVRCQLEIAAGTPLPFRQEDVGRRGHAIECRVYAEDPQRGFAPSPGRILLARLPAGPGVRCDAGIFTGAEVPVYYDPILAKVAVHAPDRPAAVARLVRALEECVVLGVATPIELLLEVVRSEPFAAGRTHTRFLDEHFPDWRPADSADDPALVGFVLDRLAGGTGATGAAATPDVPDVSSPWRRLGAWGRSA
ncbi:MAG: acetyl-CoA carboxylase biotin carboxylase subunit [Deltaproteobacteria bacterium]|nr:acetyl-CoA carboxylase biotin carboxylase subunit [Deltaproteobacteria bacterium]